MIMSLDASGVASRGMTAWSESYMFAATNGTGFLPLGQRVGRGVEHGLLVGALGSLSGLSAVDEDDDAPRLARLDLGVVQDRQVEIAAQGVQDGLIRAASAPWYDARRLQMPSGRRPVRSE